MLLSNRRSREQLLTGTYAQKLLVKENWVEGHSPLTEQFFSKWEKSPKSSLLAATVDPNFDCVSFSYNEGLKPGLFLERNSSQVIGFMILQ